jgi:hypothetical protein
MDAQATPNDPGRRNEPRESERANALAEKEKELLEFRDAGVLTQAELEEHLTRFRWGIP